ncbi:MAG TPA: decaprenyl-phosphate phosphoribosyltransferase [Candidatus Hydrogenedentes bacterium]|nr:decaprenyl-phosphate phosphoribosyltransferase [Candidatus Hydrogenedentota bacterium]
MSTVFTYTSLIIRALRVYQWPKNLLVLAALVFARQAYDPYQELRALGALIAFCLASSATYLFNDIMDIEKDRAHPEKKSRPLPSGELSISTAWIIAALLLAGGVALAWLVRPVFLLTLLFYLVLTISYSLLLKNLLIIDVMAVALGFVTRALAGAIALDVAFSNWLVVCTLFLAMFLGFSKRRHEIILLEDDAQSHRSVLYHYSIHYLDQLILIMAGGALITYTIYTCSPEVVQRLGTDKLYFTIPFVVYGLFRYLFLVHHRTGGGDPSAALFKDIPLGITVALWGAACTIIIYLI